MGDADLTYDFRELTPFVEEFRKGAEFVMGSRFRGSIEEGAMPRIAPLLRHTSYDLDSESHLSEPLLGHSLRDARTYPRGAGGDRSPVPVLGIRERDGPKSCTTGSATAEVPVKFYKDREGRVSHHKRMGWLSPWWQAGST